MDLEPKRERLNVGNETGRRRKTGYPRETNEMKQ